MDHDFPSSAFDDEPFPQHETRATSANFACPACHSQRTIPRDTGKKADAAIGTVAGAAGGISGALSGAVTGIEVGMAMAAAATAATPFGIVAGAILGALSGGIAGCAVGAALGEAVDDAILRNRRCLGCGHTFTVARR